MLFIMHNITLLLCEYTELNSFISYFIVLCPLMMLIALGCYVLEDDVLKEYTHPEIIDLYEEKYEYSKKTPKLYFMDEQKNCYLLKTDSTGYSLYSTSKVIPLKYGDKVTKISLINLGEK